MSRFKTYKVICEPKKHITDLKLELNPTRHHKGKIDYNWNTTISTSIPKQLNYNLFELIFKSIGFNNKLITVFITMG